MADIEDKKKLRAGLLVLLVLILAAIALVVINPFESLGSSVKGQTEGSAMPEEIAREVPVRTATVGRLDLRAYIRTNGDVVDTTSMDVYPEVTGKITSIGTEVGQRVEKDAVLGKIDPSRPGMVYRETAVKAPVAGTVLAVNFTTGSSVSPQAVLFRMGLLGEPEVEVSVPERHIGKVGLGSKAEATFVAYPDILFEGEVVRLAPTLNPATRTMKVGIALTDPDSLVKPGMFPSVKLYTESITGALAIERPAIQYEGNQAYVFVIDSRGVARKRAVTIGLEVDDHAQILEGLAEGETLVTQGQSLLTDGSIVRVVD